MKERPIIFSTPMVRAILAGTKTQTRRVVKCSIPICGVASAEDWVHCMANRMPVYPSQEEISKKIEQIKGLIHPLISDSGHLFSVLCPFGKVGDQLWVREAFQLLMSDDLEDHEWMKCDYKTGKGYVVSYPATHGVKEFIQLSTDEISSRISPSIHMPRWASRILLEITDVRVERLQEISEADARDEGLHRALNGQWSGGVWKHLREPSRFDDPRNAFCDLWASINGPGSWDANPWVWVVEFRRVLEASK